MQFGKVRRHAVLQNPASARVKRWRAANPEKYRKQQHDYYVRHSEENKTRATKYYAAHKEQARATVRRGRRDKRAFLAEVVGAACVDCGDDRAGAVEYHHPGGKPKGQVPLTHLSWEVLKDEALKLITLCGACHGVRHHSERLAS